MYTLQHIKAQNILEIKNAKASIYGKIYLDEGASLQELTLNNKAIIQDLSPLPYSTTYASSILFPFANRIKDGTYEFEGETFQFNINQKEEQNALHGLVYNKTFQLVNSQLTADTATISLEYIEKNVSKGFPYTYTIKLDYVFAETSIDVKLSVVNTSTKTFPFTLGWHPYFTSANLYESKLVFDSKEKLIIGARNITEGTATIKTNNALKIEDNFLDDCWILNSDKVLFETPEYNLQFNATGNNNFLQAYTPPKANTIAIEPTTGVSNSFNNKIGLNTLKPSETYAITWTITIQNN